MSNQTIQGPCGLPLGEILDLADTLGRQITDIGFTALGSRNAYFQLLGELLTDAFLSTGAAEALRPYRERLADVGRSATDAYFTPDTLSACAALGPWPEPATKIRHAEAGTWAIVTSLVMMRRLLGVPASDFLDLVVWVQLAVAVPAFVEEHPELASPLGVRRTRKRGKRRRFIRH